MTVSRSLLIGLIVSAALNVFLVGGVIGVLWVRQATQAPAAQPVSTLPPAAPPATPPAAPVVDEVAPPLQPKPPRPPRSPLAADLGPQDGKPGRPPLWTAGQGLSPESRQALRQALREANQRNQPIVRQARAERQAALQAFRSKAYDPTEVAKRLAAARTLDAQARGNVEVALSTFAAGLSSEERAALADGLARVYAPRPRADATQ